MAPFGHIHLGDIFELGHLLTSQLFVQKIRLAILILGVFLGVVMVLA
jgi:hypothetical protein